MSVMRARCAHVWAEGRGEHCCAEPYGHPGPHACYCGKKATS